MATPHGQADGGYLSNAFDFVKLVEQGRLMLIDKDFDTFVGTGLSGTIGASVLAAALNKHLLIVRKPDDTGNHSGNKVEGRIGQKWVFVDDMISSGATLQRVQEVVSGLEGAPQYVASYTYGAYRGEPLWRVVP
jgi:orotate phosphoribosyltransferase